MANDEFDRRLETFRKSLVILEGACRIQEMNIYERGGLIQYFEVCFEQAWKCLKTALAEDGIAAGSPREVIKQAVLAGLISSSYDVIDMLEDRNLTVHTYNEELAIRLEDRIKQIYLPIFRNIHEQLDHNSGRNRPT